MTDATPAAVVDRRRELLRALAAGPCSRAALADRVGVSRSTVDRGLRELETLSFVASATDGHRLTRPGRLALLAADRGRDRVADVAAVADLLAGADVGFALDPDVLDGATVVRTLPHAPDRITECVASLLADATHAAVYTSRILTRGADGGRIYHEHVREGMTCTMVATDTVFESVADARGEDVREAAALGRVGFHRVDRDDAVTLVLVESPAGPEMGLVVYDGSLPSGFVGSDTPAAVRWARAALGDVLAAATRVDPT